MQSKQAVFFVAIVVFALAVSLGAYQIGHSNIIFLTVRLLALNGYIALAIAAAMSPFLKEITLFFKKSFTNVHHYFAAAGLTLITLHPIVYAIQTLNPALLLPNFESPYQFFFFGGSIALIAIYLALVGVLLRKQMLKYWLYFHALMYIALFFGVVHANLAGRDFASLYVKVIFDALFAAAIFAFILKRYQFYQLKAKTLKMQAAKQTQT
jgi:DMSO/TMAO reductase YedYZ heme-binding membrane subunit